MAGFKHDKPYHQGGLVPTHRVIMGFVRPGSRVLEFGCAGGYMTKGFQEEMGCSVTAVEINPETAEQARPYTEKMIVGDIDRAETWDQIEGPFDAAIFADVLEHLADPWETLRRTRKVLREDGLVVSSIPNIAYYKIRKQLLLGRFDYTEYGIMDDTHIRFFTEKTTRSLFTSTGYEVTDLLRTFRAKTDRRLWRLNPNAFTYQFVVKAVPRREG